MSANVGSRGEPGTEHSPVVATVDQCETGADFVIADISRENTWISVPEAAAEPLNDRR